MQILEIVMSQRKLRAVNVLEDMIKAIRNEEYLPPITLIRDEYGVIQVDDGHHRICAFWLSGRFDLHPGEYILIESDRCRPRFGSVIDLLQRCGINTEI